MPSRLPTVAVRNVQTIAELEQQLIGRRSRVERVGEAVTRFFGSLWFVVAHAGFIALWVVVNTGAVLGERAFDPYPFAFLALVVGVEFIFLTTFVLMNQHHMARRQDRWSHLNLQICLLNERETTKALQLLDRISRHLGISEVEQDREVQELASETKVPTLVEEIERAREEGNGTPPASG
jgi:uncharacterized membrane protein